MRMVSRRGPFCDFLLALLLSSSSFSPSACPSTTTGPSALLILLQSSIVVALLLLQFLLGKKGKGIGGTPHVQYILRREEESGSITRSVDATLVATAGITRMKLTKVHWWGCLALLWLDLLTTHKRRRAWQQQQDCPSNFLYTRVPSWVYFKGSWLALLLNLHFQGCTVTNLQRLSNFQFEIFCSLKRKFHSWETSCVLQFPLASGPLWKSLEYHIN